MPRGSKPGEHRGGRVKGTPNKATAEIKDIARPYGPDCIEKLWAIASSSESDPAKVCGHQGNTRSRLWQGCAADRGQDRGEPDGPSCEICRRSGSRITGIRDPISCHRGGPGKKDASAKFSSGIVAPARMTCSSTRRRLPAHERIGNYWHCLPMYEQAKKAIWEAVNPNTGKRRIDEAFPLEIRKRTDNSSMVIEFKSGLNLAGGGL
jgi:hypothetical protein